MTMPRKTGASRKPDMYAMLRLTDDMPVLPKVVKKMLDEIPAYADITEMSITTDDGPVPTRRIAIHYTTSMPWAEQSPPMSRVTLDVTRIEPTYTPQEKN